MKTYIGEIDYPNEALACEENKDAFILSIFVVLKLFMAFVEAKMTKIDSLNPKLIVPDYHQQFWVHFERFLGLFF